MNEVLSVIKEMVFNNSIFLNVIVFIIIFNIFLMIFTYIYNKSQYKVLYGNIIYLKSDKHQINIICSDSEKRYVGKLKQELNRLPVYFVMVNQSIVVNIRHIKEFLLNEIVMDNGDYIAISKNYRKSFNMQILDLQMEQDNI